MSTRKVTVTIFGLLVAIFCASLSFIETSESCAAEPIASQDALPSNALKGASSLYLREAASGPVRWQPWNDATFTLARKINRPILIDIGAVWCHWCHVMDQTTYSDPNVAVMINSYFVPIKVDTDERPDIDGYYQVAAQAFSSGGWPLTCFATPDGAPLLIAGYLPPDASERRGMLWVLDRVKDAYAKDPNFTKLAHEVAAKIGSEDLGVGKSSSSDELRTAILGGTKAAFDEQARGQAEGASFYDFPATQMILAHGFFGHPEFTANAVARLKAIAAGGVFDQLGGGFHRYSTDAKWRVPHFEKMAYDQAMALKTYAEAYEFTREEDFARVASAIVKYVDASMLDPKTHAFYSHQDADSFSGDDGSYYTWNEDEVRRVLSGRDLAVAFLYFGLTDDPARAPDGRIVIRDAMNAGEIATKLQITHEQVRQSIDSAATKMMAARAKRRAPQVDTTVLIDRNALMASAYITAAAALGDDSLARIALEDLDYLDANARSADGSFYHLLDQGKPGVPGLAADQVYMMGAELDAYQVSGDRKYLDRATALCGLIFGSYRDSASGLLKSRAPVTAGTVVTQAASGGQVFYDDPTPAIQAAAAENFQTLAALTSHPRYATEAEQLMRPALSRIGSFAGPNNGALGLALEERADGEAVVAIAGVDKNSQSATALIRIALATYRPAKAVIRLGAPESALSAPIPEAMKAMYEAAAHRDAPLAFVCAGTACARPSANADALAKTIRNFGVNRASSGNLAIR